MDPIIVLLLTIIGVVVLAWVMQGVRLYRVCRGELYTDIYGSFFAYFYRYVILRNCSESGFLKSKIGFHRIVYSTITKEDAGKTKFCMIFYNKGVMVLCYDRATGEFLGSPASKNWNVIRTGADGKQHTYRHPNPTADLKAYLNRLASVLPGAHIEARLAFHNKADFSKLRTDVKPIHFKDIPDALAEVQAPFLPDEEVKAMYDKLIQA